MQMLPIIIRPRLCMTVLQRRFPTHHHPQLPSSGPSPHRSLHLSQSKTGLPNFRLTSLSASHSQRLKPSCPPSAAAAIPPFPPPCAPSLTPPPPSLLGLSIQALKSSAQCQHGYNFEKSVKNCVISELCWWVGEGGYEAPRVCRKVQV